MNYPTLNKLEAFTKLQGLCVLAVVLAAGCDTAEPPAFRLNMVEAVVRETPPEYSQEISDVLGAMFGTPDQPYALAETGLDQAKLDMAAGPAWSDKKGTNFGLYRKHCVHCHGVTGDGRGPTARFLNPYPRDYRPAVYKFKSTLNAARPTDADLHRVLMNGVPGTAMPSFSLLPGSEVEALVEYVKYLSIRGQMESALHMVVYELEEEEVVDENGEPRRDEAGEPLLQRTPLNPATYPEQREEILSYLEELMEGWNTANEQIIVPAEDQIPGDDRLPEEVLASAEAGRKLFYGKADCKKCQRRWAMASKRITIIGTRSTMNSWSRSVANQSPSLSVWATESWTKQLSSSLLTIGLNWRAGREWPRHCTSLAMPSPATYDKVSIGVVGGGSIFFIASSRALPAHRCRAAARPVREPRER